MHSFQLIYHTLVGLFSFPNPQHRPRLIQASSEESTANTQNLKQESKKTKMDTATARKTPTVEEELTISCSAMEEQKGKSAKCADLLKQIDIRTLPADYHPCCACSVERQRVLTELPCGHRFCERCAEFWSPEDGPNVNCPLCLNHYNLEAELSGQPQHGIGITGAEIDIIPNLDQIGEVFNPSVDSQERSMLPDNLFFADIEILDPFVALICELADPAAGSEVSAKQEQPSPLESSGDLGAARKNEKEQLRGKIPDTQSTIICQRGSPQPPEAKRPRNRVRSGRVETASKRRTTNTDPDRPHRGRGVVAAKPERKYNLRPRKETS